jgi:TolB protein
MKTGTSFHATTFPRAAALILAAITLAGCASSSSSTKPVPPPPTPAPAKPAAQPTGGSAPGTAKKPFDSTASGSFSTPNTNSTTAYNPYAPDAAVEQPASQPGTVFTRAGDAYAAISAPQSRTSAFTTDNAPNTAGATPNVTQVSFSLEGSDFDPDVSRDSKRIVFASTQHRPQPAIYIKNTDARTVTQLTSDAGQDVMPKFSPDGHRVAFASSRSGNWDIYVMPATGGKAVQLTSDTATELHPTWSPDGTQLAFCRLGQTSGRWELWVTEVNNSGVSHFIGYGLFPEWCPLASTGTTGGDRILFQRSRERGDRAFSVWSIDYKDGQASNPTEVVSATSNACINPCWSPDGKWIAYATVAADTETNAPFGKPIASELWMVSVDGTERVSLAAGRSANLMPCWAFSNKIFFVSDRGGSDNIWSLDAAGAILAATGHAPTGTNNAVGTVHMPTTTPMTPAAPAHDTTAQVPEGEHGH